MISLLRFHLSKPFVLVAMSLGAIASPTFAADLNSVNALAQTEFRALTEDLGAALGYKPLTPATPLGVTGFDIGIAVTATQIANSEVWKKAASGSNIPSTLPVPTLRALKGLPFDIDVGVMYAKIPSANIQLVGGELRWAPLPGGPLLPALALRVHTSSLSGVDQLGLRTVGADVTFSKGFVGFTPYGGVGAQRVTSSTSVTQLKGETFNQGKVFAGINWNLGLVNLAIEVDRTGNVTSGGGKIGFRF